MCPPQIKRKRCMDMTEKWVYFFDEGSSDQKSLLGGKGAGLAEMKRIGLPVPEGFTITTEACRAYNSSGGIFEDSFKDQVAQALELLELKTGKGFGNPENPLLVSVRSGAVFSMPGMMDTVLNLGLNQRTTEGLAVLSGNERFAYDCYRRFIQMFSDVVLGIPKYSFDHLLEDFKTARGVTLDTELSADDLKELIAKYHHKVRMATGHDFPTDPKQQLMLAIESVFKSWDNPRAVVYRNLNDIPHHLGTAVNIQEMVFGNLGETSGTGVAFTRNPSTGDRAFLGEFLMNAQGEDVVAGIRTPQPISALRDILPEVYEQFVATAKKLERHYQDLQDIEFTVEKGKLFILQTRNGKRTIQAAIAIAVDLVEEGMITKAQAIERIHADQLDQLLHPSFDDNALQSAKVICKGLPASPGAASGRVYFSSEDVVKAAEKGIPAILVRMETSPEDIEGMVAGNGILTARGGMTSHAAVVARGMGKCCVAGCGDVVVKEYLKQFVTEGITVSEGDFISLNGNDGSVYLGELPTQEATLSPAFATLMSWADEIRHLKVRTNADNPKDAAVAVGFGAEGIGLCRTEHMFFEEERIPVVRRMILSQSTEERQKALLELLPYQESDFKGIFQAMGPRPVNIRLLDPPLHEFLPKEELEIRALASDMGMEYTKLQQIVEGLQEFNPMLGHRGCRLAITWPEIYEMQVKAILQAALWAKAELQIEVAPEIMIPLIGFKEELKILKQLVLDTAETVFAQWGSRVNFTVGTMIEVPRAALIADEIAQEAEFFSFGTNDLTQMTLGFSRDDAGKFIGAYRKKGIFEKDPFETIDQSGVGKLMALATSSGRSVKPGLKIGICGEHGGEPKSIAFCNSLGLDYVSCSPYRVPIAKLAAAQAEIAKSKA